MKQFKNVISFVLVVVLSLGVFTPRINADEESNIDLVIEAGILKGSDQGLELEREPYRIEGLIMMLRLVGAEEKAKNYVGGQHPFEDIPDWATSYVAYAYNNELIYGISDTEFGTYNIMKANSYMTIVLRTLGYSDKEGEFDWETALEAAVDYKVIEGTSIEGLDDFDRGVMAEISAYALKSKMKNSSKTLAEVLNISEFIEASESKSKTIVISEGSSDETDNSGSAFEDEAVKEPEEEVVTEPEQEVVTVAPKDSNDEVAKEIPDEPLVEAVKEVLTPKNEKQSPNGGRSILEAGAIADASVSGLTIKGTDATAAFQYAVDNYENIYLPDGNYRIDGTVTINKAVTIYADGAIIYSDAIEGEKKGIFNVKSGGSGSSFIGLEVRSVDKYAPFMPNDTPTSLTSNRIFVNGSKSVDVLIDGCITSNLMYSVQGFGMDRLEVSNSSFEENYINIWLGDASDINIHDTYLSTSKSADVYAHCIYIGYDIYDITITDIVVKQTSEDGGALLNFAWLGGDANKYHIHGVLVDGVTIIPSETINSVIQSYGVEDAVYKNINGTILENSNDASRHSMYKGGKSNGTIVFEDCNVVFEDLNTIIRSANTEVNDKESVTFNNCNFKVASLSTQFVKSYVKNVTFNNCTLEFGEGAFNKYYGLYERGVNITFKNTKIIWASDWFQLAIKENDIKDYDLNVVIDNCEFIGQTTNKSTYVLKEVNGQNLTFTNNRAVNFFEKGRDTESIKCLVDSNDMSGFEYTFSGNSFEWN